MAYKAGFRIIKPTIKEIRGFMNYIMISSMVVTMKGTSGTIITIQNYDYYQNFLNYEGHNGRHREGQTKNNKGNYNEGNKSHPADISSEISAMRKRYSDHEIIDQALEAISLTRKTRRIADSVKLSILKSWNQYPWESVVAGIRVYLEKRYADQGKDEKYLLGIIRNNLSGTKNSLNKPIIPKILVLENEKCPRCGKMVLDCDLTPDGCVHCESKSYLRKWESTERQVRL
ncbi:MAG: hypothetical protein A4E70_01066 [Syntrophus sp. PtaU1.Bin005]|nr:MAG: hypothetical protein A4E70_01066 [Syntrophus sp. PtaU1.Bin005]